MRMGARSGGVNFLRRLVTAPRQSAILSSMNRIDVLRAAVFAAGFGFSASMPLLADDSAASIAAGGLVPRREVRIVMAKEVLQISPTKVVVDYDFRNDSDQDVTTEVAFPVPPYANTPEEDLSEHSFQSFQLWVDGKPVHFDVEAKATLEGKDVTQVLTANHIDIPTLGHFVDTVDASHTERPATQDFDRLSMTVRDQLLKAGLFEDEGGGFFRALWTANVQYHWTQIFAAHSTVHIRHEYTPVEGSELMPIDTLKDALNPLGAEPAAKSTSADEQGDASEQLELLRSFCPDPSFLRSVVQRTEASNSQNTFFAFPQWVDFILTTANTWKQPIEDFTLIIERGKPDETEHEQTLVSFCSPQNAKVEKLDADHFQVHLTNFVPTSELHIGFFDVPRAKPAQPAPKR